MMYVVMYLAAVILANLSVAAFGPSVAIVNAFLFIGLDLTARDHLHDAWRGNNLLPKMAGLIAAGSILSWLLNRDAGTIALASFLAFAAAATVDALVYHQLGEYPRWLRINGSNVPSAAVDSLVFPTLAFGGFLPGIVLGQFLAKTLGGFVWSLVFRWIDRRSRIPAKQLHS
jgi:queuosine precursor transporter